MPPLVIQKRMTPESIKALRAALPQIASMAKAATVRRLRQIAAVDTPVRTGRLLRSFDVGFTPQYIVMQWSAPYAKVVEYGAKRHDIVAKNYPTLRFMIQGRWVRPVSVNHPGFPARNYAEGVRLRAAEIFQEELAMALLAFESATPTGRLGP